MGCSPKVPVREIRGDSVGFKPMVRERLDERRKCEMTLRMEKKHCVHSPEIFSLSPHNMPPGNGPHSHTQVPFQSKLTSVSFQIHEFWFVNKLCPPGLSWEKDWNEKWYLSSRFPRLGHILCGAWGLSYLNLTNEQTSAHKFRSGSIHLFMVFVCFKSYVCTLA